jgi:predicted amidophosphoribosyltransferase
MAPVAGFLIAFGAAAWVLWPLVGRRPAPSTGFCSECGVPLEPGAHFCAECGTPVVR